jgi:hypothetical protein
MTVVRGGAGIPHAEREKLTKIGEKRGIESDRGTRVGRVKSGRR